MMNNEVSYYKREGARFLFFYFKAFVTAGARIKKTEFIFLAWSFSFPEMQ